MQRSEGAAFERKVSNPLTEATGRVWRRRERHAADDSDVVADDPAIGPSAERASSAAGALGSNPSRAKARCWYW